MRRSEGLGSYREQAFDGWRKRGVCGGNGEEAAYLEINQNIAFLEAIEENPSGVREQVIVGR